MSLGLLVERDAPAIWRGPIIMKIVQQFLRDVEWGPLDYFLVDLPARHRRRAALPGSGHPRLGRHHRHHSSGDGGRRRAPGRQDVREGGRARAGHRREHERLRGSGDRTPDSSSSPPAGDSVSPRSWASICWAASRSSPASPSWPMRAARFSSPSLEARPRPSSRAWPTSSNGRPPAARPHSRSSAAERAAGVITLLTDFGTTDSYVAEMKGGPAERGAGREPGRHHPLGAARRRPGRGVPPGPGLAPLSPRAASISRWWIPVSAPSGPPSRSGPTATGSSARTTGSSPSCCAMPRYRSSPCPHRRTPPPPFTAAISLPRRRRRSPPAQRWPASASRWRPCRPAWSMPSRTTRESRWWDR